MTLKYVGSSGFKSKALANQVPLRLIYFFFCLTISLINLAANGTVERLKAMLSVEDSKLDRMDLFLCFTILYGVFESVSYYRLPTLLTTILFRLNFGCGVGIDTF